MVVNLKYLLKSQALFLVCLDNKTDQVLGGVMLPNTSHMGYDFSKKLYKELLLKHLAKHHLSFIDTGLLSLDIEKNKAYIEPKRDTAKNCPPRLFSFNNSYHRFGRFFDPNIELSKSQSEYLDSTVISHAWGAVHNGVLIGLVFFPNFKEKKVNDPRFFNYLNDTNILLKKIGYFVSGDLVITKDGKLKFYRVLKNKSIANVVSKNWTQELILTKSLKTLI
jgi:hypothetical protein